jgi:hypothetical protein
MKLHWRHDKTGSRNDYDMMHGPRIVGWVRGVELPFESMYFFTIAEWTAQEHPIDHKEFDSLRKAMRTLRHEYIAHVVAGGKWRDDE